MKAPVYNRRATLMMKLSEQEHRQLSKPGLDALESFKQNTATHNTWFNLALRLRFALELAAEYYEDFTALEFKLAYDKSVDIFERATTGEVVVWTATEQETFEIERALVALETMQREVLRKHMAPLFRKAVSHMRANYILDVKPNPLPPKKVKQ